MKKTNDIYDVFRQNLVFAMKRTKCTQNELAYLMSVTPSYVSQIKNGHRNPGLKTIEIIAECLDIPQEDLISRKKLAKVG